MMEFVSMKVAMLDWYDREDRTAYFLREDDIDQCATERLLRNQFYDPLVSSDSEDDTPNNINWDQIFKNNKLQQKHKTFVPCMRPVALYPRLSELTPHQHIQFLKILSIEFPTVLEDLVLGKPTRKDVKDFEAAKETYLKEQEAYKEWAKSLWATDHCIRALRPKPAVERVYEAEFKMKAQRMQALPKQYDLAAQISLECGKNNCNAVLKEELIKVTLAEMPQVQIPDKIEKQFNIITPCTVPEPCQKHPYQIVLPNEEALSMLPITEIHRELASFALNNNSQYIASENALKCLTQWNRHWLLPLSVCDTIGADGKKVNVMVLDSEFSVHKEAAHMRAYKAYRHLLENALIPSSEKEKICKVSRSRVVKKGILASSKLKVPAKPVVQDLDMSSDDEDNKLFIDTGDDADMAEPEFAGFSPPKVQLVSLLHTPYASLISPNAGLCSPKGGFAPPSTSLHSPKAGLPSPTASYSSPEAAFSPPCEGHRSPKAGFAPPAANLRSPKAGFASPTASITSPKAGFASPSASLTSPKAGFASPSASLTSPKAGFASPSASLTSPKAGFASPSASLTSPKAGFASPSASLTSPKAGFASPSASLTSPKAGFASPSASLTSPKAGFASPSASLTSPKAGFASPSASLTSPKAGFASPSASLTSPKAGFASPSASLTSPKAGFASPSASLTSPKAGFASPSASLTSPKAGFASPSASLTSLKAGFASPSASLTSPKAGFASPSASLTSPKAGFASPSASLTSPKAAFTSPSASLTSPKAGFASPSASLTSPKAGFASPSASLTSPKAGFASPSASLTSPKAAFTSPSASLTSPKAGFANAGLVSPKAGFASPGFESPGASFGSPKALSFGSPPAKKSMIGKTEAVPRRSARLGGQETTGNLTSATSSNLSEDCPSVLVESLTKAARRKPSEECFTPNGGHPKRIAHKKVNAECSVVPDIGVYSCTCKGTYYEKPPRRSFRKWQFSKEGTNDKYDMIIHSPHKAKDKTEELILEPLPEYQIDLGASEQSPDVVRSVALSLALRRKASLLNVRLDGPTGEVVTFEKLSSETFTEKHPDVTRQVISTIYTALSQLQELKPGHYVLQHEPSHGANAMLMCPRSAQQPHSLLLNFDSDQLIEVDEAQMAKMPPTISTVLLPYHKHRRVLPCAFTPYENHVAKETKKPASKKKAPPQAIKFPKRRRKKNNKW